MTAWLVGVIMALLGAVGIYAKGRSDAAGKAAAKDAAAYRDTRKAADDADLGIGASDDERIKRLRDFAGKQ